MLSRIKGLIANSMQLSSSNTSPAMAGDVAYWDGSTVKTTPLSSWSTSLGTPVGVVVVPEGFAPDGKTRIIGLWGVNENGNQSSSHVGMAWGVYGTDTSLTNYTRVPTTDNAGSTSTGSDRHGYLPSDKFTGTTSYVDSKAKYRKTSNLIPSPYLGDDPNPEYYKTISGNNMLSDFNGLSNTQTLVGLGTNYTAANAAYKYKDGASNLQWYLPGMGELGYIMPRFNVINNTITTLGGLAVASSDFFWSSSDYSSYYACHLYTDNGNVNVYSKNLSPYVRPFATILTFPVTLYANYCYPELLEYLINKYGLNLGSKRNPVSIEEEIFIDMPNTGQGQAKYLHIDGAGYAMLYLDISSGYAARIIPDGYTYDFL